MINKQESFKKILGITSQPPLTHLTKTLTMKKFYVFHMQIYGEYLYYQTNSHKKQLF